MWSALLLASAASAQSVGFFCNDATRTVGLPPYEVTCEVLPPAAGTWDEVRWLMGEGTVLTGEVVTHVYEEPGAYSVGVSLQNFEPQIGESTHLQGRRDSAVTVCGDPEPRFDYIDKGGLNYQMVNLTPVDTPQCLRSIQWEVRRGAGADGALLHTFETWNPRFELPEDGVYTVEYTVDALGGVVTTSARIDAEYGLTEDYGRVQSTSCSSVPSGFAWLWLGLPVLLVTRRSRG